MRLFSVNGLFVAAFEDFVFDGLLLVLVLDDDLIPPAVNTLADGMVMSEIE